MPYTQEGLPFSGPETSRAAAVSMEPHVSRLAAAVLAYFRRVAGDTTDGVEVALNLSHQTCSPRINELAKKGLIVDSGLRRPTRSGRQATVWRVP